VLFIALPLEAAAIWSLLGGYMLLPSGFTVDVPLLPPLDKMTVTALTTLLLCLAKGTQTPRPRQSLFMYLIGAGFVLAPIFTSFTNSYELRIANLSIPGLYPLDGLKIAGRNLLMLAPLYIGARYLYTDRARSLLLKALPTALLIYSIPMLFEVRMSPQLHQWVYGYFPGDSFSQQIRGTGYRPVVFMEHGLALAFFTSLALLAAVVLARTKAKILHLPAGAAAAYLGGLLVICKSLGPAIYAILLTPLFLFTRPRLWVKIACAMSLLICAYPLLRNNGLAPTQLVSKVASAISVERSASFTTRVQNEEQLLARANQKPLFGWGTWGRNRVYDQDTGKDLSITDGGWVLQFGTFGWFGYLTLFGLLSVATFRAHRAIGKGVTQESIDLGGLSILLGVYLVDQIPNANPLALTLLIAGSIAATARAQVARPIRRPIPRGMARAPVPVSP
jgi:hypothetical protein